MLSVQLNGSRKGTIPYLKPFGLQSDDGATGRTVAPVNYRSFRNPASPAGHSKSIIHKSAILSAFVL